jgi:hypothetical protein
MLCDGRRRLSQELHVRIAEVVHEPKWPWQVIHPKRALPKHAEERVEHIRPRPSTAHPDESTLDNLRAARDEANGDEASEERACR